MKLFNVPVTDSTCNEEDQHAQLRVIDTAIETRNTRVEEPSRARQDAC